MRRTVDRQVLGVTIVTVYALELALCGAIVIYFFFTATKLGRALLWLGLVLMGAYMLEQPVAYFLARF